MVFRTWVWGSMVRGIKVVFGVGGDFYKKVVVADEGYNFVVVVEGVLAEHFLGEEVAGEVDGLEDVVGNLLCGGH